MGKKRIDYAITLPSSGSGHRSSEELVANFVSNHQTFLEREEKGRHPERKEREGGDHTTDTADAVREHAHGTEAEQGPNHTAGCM